MSATILLCIENKLPFINFVPFSFLTAAYLQSKYGFVNFIASVQNFEVLLIRLIVLQS